MMKRTVFRKEAALMEKSRHKVSDKMINLFFGIGGFVAACLIERAIVLLLY